MPVCDTSLYAATLAVLHHLLRLCTLPRARPVRGHIAWAGSDMQHDVVVLGGGPGGAGAAMTKHIRAYPSQDSACSVLVCGVCRCGWCHGERETEREMTAHPGDVMTKAHDGHPGRWQAWGGCDN